MVNDSKNKGLTSNFTIKDGKFNLVGGEEKAYDNLVMMLSFSSWFRLFTPDYIVNFHFLFQRSSNYILKYKNIFRLSAIKKFQSYTVGISINNIDIGNTLKDRKVYYVDIQYKYDLVKDTTMTVTRFVKVT